MCRFLVVKSKQPVYLASFLESFSKMSEKSKTPDGDLQADGWGICWQNNKSWNFYKSIFPIWKSKEKFSRFPKSKLFLIHSRSSTFKKHKDNIAFNQPFVWNNFAYVFNGSISKIRLKQKIMGEVGSQKIFYLIRQKFEELADLKKAIISVFNLIRQNSLRINGLNLSIIYNQKVYSFSFFTKYPDYYQLWFGKGGGIKVISSEKIKGDLYWSKIKREEVFLI